MEHFYGIFLWAISKGHLAKTFWWVILRYFLMGYFNETFPLPSMTLMTVSVDIILLSLENWKWKLPIGDNMTNWWFWRGDRCFSKSSMGNFITNWLFWKTPIPNLKSPIGHFITNWLFWHLVLYYLRARNTITLCYPMFPDALQYFHTIDNTMLNSLFYKEFHIYRIIRWVTNTSGESKTWNKYFIKNNQYSLGC